MPDPKIQPVIDEINALLVKNGLCAIVFVASQTHTQFLLQLEAPWTCITAEGKNGIRFRAMSTDYASKAEQKKVIEDSSGLVLGFADAARDTARSLDRLAQFLSHQFEITHVTRREFL